MARRPRPMERRPPRPDHRYNSSPDRQVPSWSG
jgi:hypothetical protein